MAAFLGGASSRAGLSGSRFSRTGGHTPVGGCRDRVSLGAVTDLNFETVGFGEHAVEYVAAWDLQRQVHADVVAGGRDTVLLLEHPPVFTAGKRTEPHERPFTDDGTPVIDV